MGESQSVLPVLLCEGMGSRNGGDESVAGRFRCVVFLLLFLLLYRRVGQHMQLS